MLIIRTKARWKVCWMIVPSSIEKHIHSRHDVLPSQVWMSLLWVSVFFFLLVLLMHLSNTGHFSTFGLGPVTDMARQISPMAPDTKEKSTTSSSLVLWCALPSVFNVAFITPDLVYFGCNHEQYKEQSR